MKKHQKILLRIIISTILIVAISFLPIKNNTFLGIAYILPYLIIGYDVLIKAVKGIFNGQILDENFLMAIASVGALVLGFIWKDHFLEAPLVLLFYQVGEYFQGVAVRKSQKNISSLMELSPDYAYLEKDGEILRVSPEEVEIGSIMVVRTGEKVAIDGEVASGSACLSTLAMTGESEPVDVKEGDSVISGSVNQGGIIKVKTTKLYNDSTVAKVLALIERALSKKAKAEKFISKFARFYTPIVCILALLIATIPTLIGLIFSISVNGLNWLYRGLSFLVISCPCALVISVPLTFFSCIGGLSKSGVLVKGSSHIENLSKIKTVVFDKTGTLTDGKIKVKDVYFEKISEREFIEYLVLLESGSSHPLAKSVCEKYKIPVDFTRVKEYNEEGGYGISALIDNDHFYLGNLSLMQRAGIKLPINLTEKAVYLGKNKEFIGYITFLDSVKGNAKTSLEELYNNGVNNLVMLTGDNENKAKIVAEKVGISKFYASLLPDQKQEILSKIMLEKSNGKVAFVGDGINDAPSLMTADVGISMGAVGSDVAIESSSVVIIDDDILKVPLAIKSARKCMRIVKQNVIFSIAIKVAVLILSALGIANMFLAIFADVGVMILAILNSFRALINKGE